MISGAGIGFLVGLFGVYIIIALATALVHPAVLIHLPMQGNGLRFGGEGCLHGCVVSFHRALQVDLGVGLLQRAATAGEMYVLRLTPVLSSWMAHQRT